MADLPVNGYVLTSQSFSVAFGVDMCLLHKPLLPWIWLVRINRIGYEPGAQMLAGVISRYFA